MYELKDVTATAGYIDCPSRIGFYYNGDSVYFIDSGSGREASRKAKQVIDSKGLELKAVFNTHSHADHIGGNEFLQSRTGCRVYAAASEAAMTKYTFLEPTVLYGGMIPPELNTRFFIAKPCDVDELDETVLPDGLEVIELKGHSPDMCGFRTGDGVVFLGDALAGEETLEKYKITYNYNIADFLSSLEKIKHIDGNIFIPSHVAATENIIPLAQLNISKAFETAETIKEICEEPKIFEEVLQKVFEKYEMTMSIGQYSLIGSTVKAYLSFLEEKGEMRLFPENNKMMWQKK